MGHRTNIVVIEQGKNRLYYDHWLGARLDMELVWGQQLFDRFLRQYPPVEPIDSFLPQWWLSEGGLLLDYDEKRLAFYGGTVSLSRERLPVLLEVLGFIWPGWKVGHLDGGPAELRSLAGYPRLDERDSSNFWQSLSDNSPPEDNRNCLISYQRGENQQSWVEPQGLCFLTNFRGTHQLKTQSSNASYSEPTEGIYIDESLKLLAYWSASVVPDICTPLAKQLGPDWKLISGLPAYKVHKEKISSSDRQLLSPTLNYLDLLSDILFNAVLAAISPRYPHPIPLKEALDPDPPPVPFLTRIARKTQLTETELETKVTEISHKLGLNLSYREIRAKLSSQ